MKYKYLFDELISQEYEKIMQGVIKSDQSNKRYEWRVIVNALMYPNFDEGQLFIEFKNKTTTKITKEEYLEMLRAVNLDLKEKRIYIAKRMRFMDRVVIRFLEGDMIAAREMERFLSELNERDTIEKRLYFNAKYLLCYLICMDEVMLNQKGEIVLSYCMEPFCAKIVRDFYHNVMGEMDEIEHNDQVKDMMEKTRRLLLESRNKDMTQMDVKQLQFEINNYRNTLDLLQGMFDQLQDRVNESAIDAKKEAVREFYISLNAAEYGNILDNILVVDQRLRKIRKDHGKIQPEMMPLAIIFKQLFRFIGESGIMPIEEIGRRFIGDYEDITQMNYEGEPYTNDNEKKRLEVVSPGWKYKDIVISLPTVREI